MMNSVTYDSDPSNILLKNLAVQNPEKRFVLDPVEFNVLLF